MTKADIVDIISSSTGLTKVETEAVVKGFMETVIDAMKRGETIELRASEPSELLKELSGLHGTRKPMKRLLFRNNLFPCLRSRKILRKR